MLKKISSIAVEFGCVISQNAPSWPWFQMGAEAVNTINPVVPEGVMVVLP